MGIKDFTEVLRNRSLEATRMTFTLSGAPSLIGATVKIMIKKFYGDQSRLTLEIGDGLTILNQTATVLDFQIDKQIITLLAFEYIYDVEIFFANGDKKTWLGGKFTVIDTVTT